MESSWFPAKASGREQTPKPRHALGNRNSMEGPEAGGTWVHPPLLKAGVLPNIFPVPILSALLISQDGRWARCGLPSHAFPGGLIHAHNMPLFRRDCIIPFLPEEIGTQRCLPTVTQLGSSETGLKSRFPQILACTSQHPTCPRCTLYLAFLNFAISVHHLY